MRIVVMHAGNTTSQLELATPGVLTAEELQLHLQSVSKKPVDLTVAQRMRDQLVKSPNFIKKKDCLLDATPKALNSILASLRTPVPRQPTQPEKMQPPPPMPLDTDLDAARVFEESPSLVHPKQAIQTAAERGVTLDEVQVATMSGMGVALVMDPTKNKGKSLAADPAREKQNEEFERRLGIAAFNDPRANVAAALLCTRVKRYLEAKWPKPDPADKDFLRTLKVLAGEKNFAGAVCQAQQTGKPGDIATHTKAMHAAITEVIEQGNLRERMFLVEQFMKLVGSDLATARKDQQTLGAFLKLAEQAGMDRVALQEAAGSSGKLLDETVESSITQESRDQARVPAAKPTKTTMTPHSLYETPLSSRERRHQGELEKEAARRDQSLLQQGYDQRLHFTEGARYFLVNEQSKWAERLRALSLPLTAGPSGHTDVFFRANRLLGTDVPPEIIRLAAIGHLMPIHAHSLVEILDVAAKWKCGFSLNHDLYASLPPYSKEELRAIGGGALPGEQPELPGGEPWAITDVTEAHRPADDVNEPLTYKVKTVAHEITPQQHSAFLESRKIEQLDELAALRKAEHVSKLDKAPSMEAHLATPKLSSNVRDALRLASEESASHETAARAKVEERLGKLGFGEPAKLYDRIVARLAHSPVTINLRTNIIERLLQGGEYLNQWERSAHPARGKKAYAGDGEYAVKRNETEKAVHGLPEMDEIGEAAAEISKERREQNEKRLAAAKRALDANRSEQEELASRQEELDVEIPVLQGVIDLLEKQAASGGKDQGSAVKDCEHKRQQRQEKTSEAAAIKKKREALQAQRPALELAHKQAELEMRTHKGVLREASSDAQGFRDKRSAPRDRPHSAAVSVSFRAGSAAAPVYGTSHLVLRDDVKARSTLTGGDSIEQIYKKMKPHDARAAVGTFDHLGVVLLEARDDTLRLLAEEAEHPEKPRSGAQALYLEVQVFGSVNMSRDVSKIVIDEDDLAAWERGDLVGESGEKLPARSRSDVKKSIARYAEAHGIDVQYIRTGDAKREAGPGELRGAGAHLNARRQGWEEEGEAILRAFRAGNWAPGLALSAEARDQGSGSIFGPSYKTSGLTALAATMQKLQSLAANGSEKKSESELMALASEALASFYASPFSPEHLDEVRRVLTNCIVALRTCVLRDLSKEQTKQDGRAERRSGDSKLLRQLRPEHESKQEEEIPPKKPVEVPASSSLEKPEIPKSGINHAYMYEDMDMYRILNEMVRRHELADTVHVLPPCDNIVVKQLSTRLTEDQTNHRGHPRSIMVPFNLGNFHWVGMFIEVGTDESNVRVRYMDPLHVGTSVPAAVKEAIKTVFPDARFLDAAHMLQSDGTSCGPVTIQNLVLRARGIPPGTNTIMEHDATEALRQEHVDLLRDIDHGFEARQRDNRSTISSVFDASAYLARTGSSTFSPKEAQRILQISDYIRSLPDEARLPVEAAFASIRSNPDMDNGFYFGLLRTALHDAYRVTGRFPASQNAMGHILTALWGISYADAAGVRDFADVDRFKFRDFEEVKAIGLRVKDENCHGDLELLNAKLKEQEAEMAKLVQSDSGKRKE